MSSFSSVFSKILPRGKGYVLCSEICSSAGAGPLTSHVTDVPIDDLDRTRLAGETPLLRLTTHPEMHALAI